jgi:tetratricopeptide (TPR) repeat protein
MQAKIEWYKEVLELEPGSKVFFPLARLLAENGQWQDALSTLRLGLERHPEFIEARLYLIELLYKNGQIAQCEPQIGQLTRLFSKYPGFWEAWGACAEDTKKRDLSLTLRFLAVLFQRPDIGLDEVVEIGLRSFALAEKEMTPVPASWTETGKTILPAGDVAAPFSMSVETQQAPTMDADDPPRSHHAEFRLGDDVAPADDEPPPPAIFTDETDDTEEPFSLRTKSMADVLAGQGDSEGALEIYRELAIRTDSPQERQEIDQRIAQLSSSQTQTADMTKPSAPELSPPGKQRMQHLLESLAERLESRALG